MFYEHGEEESGQQDEQLSQNFRYDFSRAKPDEYDDRP